MKPVTEEELIASATAPRVTAEGLDANIASHYCFNVLKVLEALNEQNPDEQMPIDERVGVLTICVVVLKNGFTVIGESACADPKNYNADIGNRLALANAKNKIWALMGYALKQELYLAGDGSFVDRMKREHKELEDKIDKLAAFTTTETYAGLDSVSRQLLLDQKAAMLDYADALGSRLDRQG